jgi:SAM-dependent methyltransferase
MDHHQLFSQDSGLYASVRPQYPPQLFNYLAELCEQHQEAWDGACGNGQAAISLARFFHKVQATDISESQIEHAIPNPRVTYSFQPSEKTNFQENQFDLVCSAQALHWFKFDQFWPEVKRVLKPGAVFAAWGYAWFMIDEQIDKVIQQDILETLQPYWAKQNKLLWDHYKDVPLPFQQITPPKFEMVVNWNLNQLFDYLRSWTATRRAIKDIGDRFLSKALKAVEIEWGDPNERKNVIMDFCMLVGRN